MKIIITGASGMVGSEVVRQAILDDDIEEITCIVRKPLDIQHPKVITVIHKDFLNYYPLTDVFKNNDACIWCLGISQTQVSKKEYEIITYDYTLAAAKQLLKDNPSITFLFTSGEGADSTEKSWTLFARIKGRTENALIKLGLRNLYIIRPGAIQAINEYKNEPWAYKLIAPFYPLINLLVPFMVIKSTDLARAILAIVKNGFEKQIIDNKDLRKLG